MRSGARFGLVCGAALAAAALLLARVTEAPVAAAVKERVVIDGSSTVAPIMMAAAELFRKEHKDISVRVGISGTGGGFKRFLDKLPTSRTDVSNASRPISPLEKKLAAEESIAYIEIPICYDGMAIVVNPKNTWCDHLTVEELRRIWQPGSRIDNWKDVRAGFPDKPLRLFGPGADSGTYDYFAEAIVHAGDTRSDFNASENDNALVTGVAGDEGGLGYFGFAYYDANRDSLKLLGIDNGDGKPLTPTVERIRTNEYRPLSRPLFIYVNAAAAARPDVRKFVHFLLLNAKRIVEHPKVGYVALDPELYTMGLKRFNERVAGSVYSDAASVHRPLAEAYGTGRTQTP